MIYWPLFQNFYHVWSNFIANINIDESYIVLTLNMLHQETAMTANIITGTRTDESGKDGPQIEEGVEYSGGNRVSGEKVTYFRGGEMQQANLPTSRCANTTNYHISRLLHV